MNIILDTNVFISGIFFSGPPSQILEAWGKIGIYLISNGDKHPYRVKLRSPWFSNLSLFGELAKGHLLQDAVSILGSLDLVIPEIDR